MNFVNYLVIALTVSGFAVNLFGDDMTLVALLYAFPAGWSATRAWIELMETRRNA